MLGTEPRSSRNQQVALTIEPSLQLALFLLLWLSFPFLDGPSYPALHVYLCSVCTPGARGSSTGIHSEDSMARFSASGVTACCELLCGRWEPNLGSLGEQRVHLTTKLSLWPLGVLFAFKHTLFTLRVCAWLYMYHGVYMWSEDNTLIESALSYQCIASGGRTQLPS